MKGFQPGQHDFQTLLEGQEDLICRFHHHELQAHQCGSILLQQIKAPVDTVWSVLRQFDKPQVYKRFIESCDMIEGDGGVGTVREVHVVSSIPATSSIERLEILDEEEHIISFRVLGGGHRLQNYGSVTSLHAHEIDGQIGTLVLESYQVDIPEGNTREETHMFVDTVVRCNLKALSQVSDHKFFHTNKASSPKASIASPKASNSSLKTLRASLNASLKASLNVSPGSPSPVARTEPAMVQV